MKKNSVGRIIFLRKKLQEKNLGLMADMLTKYLRIVFSCDIPKSAQIDDSVHFVHNALGVVIHKDVIIEEGAKILHNVTLGGNMGKQQNGRKAPHIGKNVTIAVGAKIIGPVYIGDNTIIGANSVVISDIPANSVAVGIPAKVIQSHK